MLGLPVAEPVIEQEPRGADGQRDQKDRRRAPIVLSAQGAAAHGGGNDGGKTAQGADQQPDGKADVGQSGEVAQQILRRAGQHEDDQKQHVPFGCGLQEADGAQLFRRKEYLGQRLAEPPHQQKHAYTAQRGGQHAEDRAFHRAKSVAGGDLEGFAGDQGHHDLKDHHAHIRQTSAEAVGIHPGAESLRLRGKAHQRYADQPDQQSHYNDGDHQRDNAQPFLLGSG